MSQTLVYNRQTKELEPEPFFGQNATLFFHENPLGFFLMETFLKWRWLSNLQAIYYHSSLSKKDITPFVETYQIDANEIERNLESFDTFNDFFIRKLKTTARPFDTNPQKLISPADSRLIAYPIQKDLIVPVKGISFTLSHLIQNKEIAESFLGGLCLIFRLAPIDYHRFCYVDDVTFSEHITLNGCYRSVNPVSLAKNKPVFTENQRQYCLMESQNFGQILHMDVGAIGVGRIIQIHPHGGTHSKGDEKGYFEFGGSTSVLLFQKDQVQIDQDIMSQSKQGNETLVRYRETIGTQK